MIFPCQNIRGRRQWPGNDLTEQHISQSDWFQYIPIKIEDVSSFWANRWVPVHLRLPAFTELHYHPYTVRAFILWPINKNISSLTIAMYTDDFIWVHTFPPQSGNFYRMALSWPASPEGTQRVPASPNLLLAWALLPLPSLWQSF